MFYYLRDQRNDRVVAISTNPSLRVMKQPFHSFGQSEVFPGCVVPEAKPAPSKRVEPTVRPRKAQTSNCAYLMFCV